MDSYFGLCRAPLPAPPAIAVHINQRRGTSSPSPSEREMEEGGMKQTLSKRPGLHISWHITDVLPQLRRQLIRTFMKGEKSEGERGGKEQKSILNMHLYISLSFRSFF